MLTHLLLINCQVGFELRPHYLRDVLRCCIRKLASVDRVLQVKEEQTG